jgi:sulfatase maturation enzyme AslB (radical SAM superfamily)
MNEENDVIIETEPELEIEPQPKTYCCIMTDITSGCNLRCKFCVQDWKQNTGNILMSKETFANVIKVMPLTHDGWSLFS